MSKEEVEKAKGWLSGLDVNSEFEAISKEIILQYTDQLEQENNKGINIKIENQHLKEQNEELKQIVDLMSLDLLNISKGNFNINEKQYSSAESVKLDYIRLLKEEDF